MAMMNRMKQAAQHKNRRIDIPDYKPFPLRHHFLVVLFLIVCGLAALLEYLINTLPHETDRTKIPNDSSHVPFNTDSQHRQAKDHAAEQPMLLVRGRSKPRDGSSATITQTSHHRSFPTGTHSNRGGTTVAPRAVAIASPDARPPSDHYANTDPITTYVTRADFWYGFSGDYYARTPLFPGDSRDGKCVHSYPGVVMTSDSSACLAIIGLGGNTPPPGWKRAPWLMNDIWFPVGGGCEDDYEKWYPPHSSNATEVPTPLYPVETRYKDPEMERCMTGWNACSYLASRRRKHRARRDEVLSPARRPRAAEPAGTPVLWVYGGFFWKGPSGNVTIRQYYILKLPLAANAFGGQNYGIGATEFVFASQPPKTIVTEAGSTTLAVAETKTDVGSSTSSETSFDTDRSDRIPTTRVEAQTATQTMPTESTTITSESDKPSSSNTDRSEPSSTSPGDSPAPSEGRLREQTLTTHHDPAQTVSDTRPPGFTSTIASSPSNSGPSQTESLHLSSTQTPLPSPSSSSSSARSTGARITVVSMAFIEMPTTSTVTYTQTKGPGPSGPVSVVVSTITTQVLIGVPALMVPAQLTTITDPHGQPVATVTEYYGNELLHASTTVTTVTDSRGSALTTLTQQIPTGPSVVQTLTDAANGAPTATVTVFPVAAPGPAAPGSSPAKIVVAKAGSYFAVYFFPVILTALLLLPIQAIDAEIKIFSPFRLLTLHQGKGANTGGSRDALTMQTGGLAGRWNGLRLLLWKHGDPISLVGDLMIACAAGLVSLSGETVGLKLRGTCIRHNLNTCFVTIAVFPAPARAAQALLAALMVLIVVLGVMLSRWRTGTAAHPTSVAAVCSLMQIPGTRGLVQGLQVGLSEGYRGGGAGEMGGRKRGDSPEMHQRFGERLKEITFRLGRAESGSGTRRAEDYGLIGVAATKQGGGGGGGGGGGAAEKAATGETVHTVQARVAVRTLVDGGREPAQKMRFNVPVKERIEQALYLFFLCGLLILILYYENTVFEDPAESPFESFMDSQSFGVRMLFTSFGLMVSFMWDHLFSNFAKRDIYRRMAQRPQPAALSVLQPRATNLFTGMWRSIRQRDSLGVAMALAGILSRFLPLLLSSVPFAAAQTWITHEICTWLAVALLCIMIIVLLGHVWLVKWPHMPAAAPDSLACCVYYVCDSAMLRDFERLSMLGSRERDRRVERMGRMYRFGWMTGVSGEKRVGIDYPEGEQGFKLRTLDAVGFGIAGTRR